MSSPLSSLCRLWMLGVCNTIMEVICVPYALKVVMVKDLRYFNLLRFSLTSLRLYHIVEEVCFNDLQCLFYCIVGLHLPRGPGFTHINTQCDVELFPPDQLDRSELPGILMTLFTRPWIGFPQGRLVFFLSCAILPAVFSHVFVEGQSIPKVCSHEPGLKYHHYQFK